MLYLEIYVGCMIVMLGLMLFTKNKFDKIEKTIIVVLAPIMIIVGIISVIDQMRKRGVKGVLPRLKNKAYPLEEGDFRYWPKDTVICDDHKMSLHEYNRKANKSLTLDDIYGVGYCATLTPEEVFECKTFIPGKYGLQPDMPESKYKDIAIAFAQAFNAKDITPVLNFISEETRLVVFDKDESKDKQLISDYFTSWFERASRDNLQVRVRVAWNPNQCRPAVYIKPSDFREMILLFYFNGNVLEDIVFGPSHIQSDMCRFHDLDTPPYNMDFISHIIGNDAESKQNHLCCPTCGTDSSVLVWRKFDLPLGIHGYCGDVSICPNCKRVVEFLPNIRLRYDSPQQIKLRKVTTPDAEPFTPRLLGLYTFETSDDNMDFYTDSELNDRSEAGLRAYRRDNDLEKGNDAAIIYANGPMDDYGLELFTEIAEKGCHNAMLNVFTMLWSNKGEYLKAAEWLKYITAVDNPSIKCLYNLAVLYYLGENLPNNPLKKDRSRAKEFLSRIKDIPGHSVDNDLRRVITNAHIFYSLIDSINEFANAGIQIHHIITKSIVKTKDLKDKGELFFRAKALSLKPGYKLGLHVASDETGDIGDESFFYIYDKENVQHKIYKSRLDASDIDTSLILVQPTAMGAWQLYLLMTSPTIMPVFWHGGYIVRKYIFSLDDLNTIEPIQRMDFSILHHDGILLPSVILSDDGKSADVYCTYWNDWKGLMREHVKIIFNSDGTANYGQPDEFCYYHYDCGICF